MLARILPLSTSDIERFKKFVEPRDDAGCWEWIGYTHLSGRGIFWLNGLLTGCPPLTNTVRKETTNG